MTHQENVNPSIIDALTCPITLEIFVDPVLASDGYTYERSAIVEWIKYHNNTSPMTRQPIKIKQLKSNHLVKQLADKYRSSLTSNIGKELVIFSGAGTLLNSEQKILLDKLFPKEKKWSLIYKATRDGFASSDFHELCNNRGATLTLIQTRNRLCMKNRRMIFGGYTTVPWSSQQDFHPDPQAFLFQFIENKLTRFNIRSDDEIAVSHCVSSGPIFGFEDIHICHRSNDNNLSYSRFPDCYEDADPKGKGRKTFSKSRYFLVSEIEVYKVIV